MKLTNSGISYEDTLPVLSAEENPLEVTRRRWLLPHPFTNNFARLCHHSSAAF